MIPRSIKQQFDGMVQAARDGALALVETHDPLLSKQVFVICCMGMDEEVTMYPFGTIESRDALMDRLDAPEGAQERGA